MLGSDLGGDGTMAGAVASDRGRRAGLLGAAPRNDERYGQGLIVVPAGGHRRDQDALGEDHSGCAFVPWRGAWRAGLDACRCRPGGTPQNRALWC